MSQERRRRAQRIVEARQRKVDFAEAELATSSRRTIEAKDVAESATTAWKDRMQACPSSECSSDDLALEHAYLSTLEKRAERLAQIAREAKAVEEGARLKVCNAKTEHKKVETWRDRWVEASKLEEARIERIQSDEFTARLTRNT